MTPQTIPMNHDAEEAVIGAILRDLTLAEDVRLIMHPLAFSNEKFKAIYSAMCTLNDAGKPLDPVIIADQVRGAVDFGSWNIEKVLHDACFAVPTSETALYHATIVAEKAKSRDLITICEQTLRRAYAGEPGVELLEDLQRQAGEIAESGIIDIGKSASELVDPVWESMMGTQAGNGIPGLSTGLPELDNAIGGLKHKHLIVAAAFAKVGKTALGLNIAAHVAMKLKV
ncbi:MAG TPA: DnaB-like helicase N-terminal domain-containing protein, partial [Phycisphaerae bacterium]|nr:DnaB-like helicase N-terminal domain-containing protein [Phycisphaerae bacterium]